jgi:subtilase family serine protease
LQVEELETRALLSASVLNPPLVSPSPTTNTQQTAAPIPATATAYTQVTKVTATPAAGTGPGGGYAPNQLAQAYGFNQTNLPNNGGLATGAGQTIAIVDAYYDPHIQSDLATFDSQFGLNGFNGTNLPTFTQYQQNGVTHEDTGWDTETALDVEWAHAMAPQANILLVESQSNNLTDMFNAVTYAASQPGVSVVSMSWGAGEFAGETSYDSTFTTPSGHNPVTFIASSGDNGSFFGLEYPSASPNVLSVGGTTLTLNASNNIQSETGWFGSGGGISRYEPEPSYQKSVQTSGKRENPDVAYNANPNTGYSIYDTGGSGGWTVVGGTSAGAPQWASIVALADQYRAAPSVNLPTLGHTPADVYSLPSSDFHDVTSGSNGRYRAGPGYDLVTGRGSPIVNLIVPGLGTSGSNAPSSNAGAPNATPAPGKAHAHDLLPGDPGTGSVAANPVATPDHISAVTLSATPLATTARPAVAVTDTGSPASAALALGSSSSPLLGGSFLGASGLSSPTSALAFNSLGMTYFGRPGTGWDAYTVGGSAALSGDAVTPAMAQQILEGQDALPADPVPDALDATPEDVGGGDGDAVVD